MKKFITIGFLILIFYILDNTWIPIFINFNGYYPSLLMIFLISYSIVNGSYEGIWIGTVGGILQDIFFVHTFGINVFSNILVCLLAGFVGKSIFRQKTLIPIIAIGILSVIKGGITIILLYVFKEPTNYYFAIYPSVINLLIAIFMYKRIYKLSKKDFMIREWKF